MAMWDFSVDYQRLTHLCRRDKSGLGPPVSGKGKVWSEESVEGGREEDGSWGVNGSYIFDIILVSMHCILRSLSRATEHRQGRYDERMIRLRAPKRRCGMSYAITQGSLSVSEFGFVPNSPLSFAPYLPFV